MTTSTTSPIIPYFPLTSYVDHRILAASTAEAHYIPSGKTAVIITTDVDLYIKADDTATVPSADVLDGAGAAYIPAGVGRAFSTGGVGYISLIAAAAAAVTLEFFS
jgi:hypothetical protein